MKNKYNPKPYSRKDKEGKIVPQKDRAETAANYLVQEQRGKQTEQDHVRFQKEAIDMTIQTISPTTQT